MNYSILITKIEEIDSKFSIRIFGPSLHENRICCLHVSDFLNYFFLQLPEEISELPDSRILEFAKILMIELKEKHGVSRIDLLDSSYKTIYGYHEHSSETPLRYLKLIFKKKTNVEACESACRRGIYLGSKKFQLQPLDSHIPHKVKFFSDFNLNGMDILTLEISKTSLRLNKDEAVSEICRNFEISKNLRQSTCSLELESSVSGILKNEESSDWLLPSLRKIWNLEKRRCLDFGIKFPEFTQDEEKESWRQLLSEDELKKFAEFFGDSPEIKESVETQETDKSYLTTSSSFQRTTLSEVEVGGGRNSLA